MMAVIIASVGLILSIIIHGAQVVKSYPHRDDNSYLRGFSLATILIELGSSLAWAVYGYGILPAYMLSSAVIAICWVVVLTWMVRSGAISAQSVLCGIAVVGLCGVCVALMLHYGHRSIAGIAIISLDTVIYLPQMLKTLSIGVYGIRNKVYQPAIESFPLLSAIMGVAANLLWTVYDLIYADLIAAIGAGIIAVPLLGIIAVKVVYRRVVGVGGKNYA